MKLIRSWFTSTVPEIPPYSADFNKTTRSLPEANKWSLSDFVLQKLVPIIGVRPYPLDELLLMCATMAYFKPNVVIEWGTHLGKRSRVFYELSNHLRSETVVHSIDLPPGEEHIENLADMSQRAVFVRGLPVNLHYGDGVTIARNLLVDIRPVLPLFFVDGDHSFESVLHELTSIKEMSARAVVLAHDTFLQGPESGYNCGPYDAFKKFTDDNQLPMQSTILGLPGMSLMYWL